MKLKKLYCKHCKKWVHKGVKYYQFLDGLPDEKRYICEGCNTDWAELEQWAKTDPFVMKQEKE